MDWFLNGDIDAAWGQMGVDGDGVEEILAYDATSLRWSLASLLSEVSSPIERRLLVALLARRKTNNGTVPPRAVRVTMGDRECRLSCDSDHGVLLDIKMQHSVGNYRADFLVSWVSEVRPEGIASVSTVVEADGHDFHERTKKQAAHDKRRDREMQAQGLAALRFTGSEIHRDAFACAGEVFDFLRLASTQRGIAYGASTRRGAASENQDSQTRVLVTPRNGTHGRPGPSPCAWPAQSL